MRFRIASKLLFLKLVILFVLFGMLVGYMSFISGTALASYQLYRSFEKGFNTQLKDVMSSDRPDLLYRAFVEEPEVGKEIIRNMEKLIPRGQTDSLYLSLMAYDPVPESWSVLGTINSPSQAVSITEEKIKALETTLKSDSFYKPELYLGQQEHRQFYIDISGEDDRLSYVMEISLEREGFKNFIENEKSSFITFTTMVLVFSLILGSFFAKSISRPIHKLSDKAIEYAGGDMDIRFHSRRWDDIGTLARSLDKMSRNLNHRFNSMQTMNRIDRAVLSSVSRNELLMQVSSYISEQFDNTTAAVLEHREEGLVISALVPEREHTIGRLIFYSDLPERLRNRDETILIRMDDPGFGQKKESLLFPRAQQKSKALFLPIIHNEKTVATFAITLDRVSDQDREALVMLTDQVGVALRSKLEMDKREELLQGTLIALTRSVDAKSRWTAGHTERVARLSVLLAGEMGLSRKEIENVRIAALLHDIGKLGIPEAILDKPGKLDDQEFDLIKSHPEKGDTIIKDTPGLEEIRKGVRHHHERWDGSGYPDGLKSDDIPLIARIITIADVYDAVTEDRPYRSGFTAEKTHEFLCEQRGLLFDPELLDSFLTVLASVDSPL